MGLREMLASEVTANPTGCRVYMWVTTDLTPPRFNDDDQNVIWEELEKDTPTDELIRRFRRWDLPRIGKDVLNDHRRNRCTCPDNVRGRYGAA